MSLLFDVVVVAAVVAVYVAYKKHKTTVAVVASAKKEASILETIGSKIADEAKVAYDAVVARLKALKA